MIFGTRAMAKELGISEFTVNKYCRKGMPYEQFSERKRVYDLDEVKGWIKEQAQNQINERNKRKYD